MPLQSTARALIVNADDFGAGEGVNDGVLEAHSRGVVTSASMMAGGAAFADALARLDDFPTLGVGVHLTLCAGAAVLAAARAPTLIDEEGRLPANALAFAKRYFGGRLRRKDIRAELEAQLGRVRDAGVAITHVDSHQHLHNLPGISEDVITLARRFGVRAARASRCRIWPPGRGWLTRQVLLRINAEAFRAAARQAGLKTPEGLLGQGDVGRLTPASILRETRAAAAGTWELLCHPARGCEPGDDPAMDRAAELAALTDPDLREGLREQGVRLLNFAAL